MTAILNAIWCFLQNMIASFRDVWVEAYDSILGVADALLAAVGTGALSAGSIPDQYAWMLGATGMSQALTIIAGAMGVRFLLQLIPFTRLGS